MRLLFAALFLAVSTLQAAESPRFFVSREGNDAWTGQLPAPNEGRTDGPFATLTRARDAVRTAHGAGAPAGGVVTIRAGDYELPEPLILGPEDSGKEGAPLVFEAHPGETPLISGGRRITGWRVADGRWEVTLPEVAKGEWAFAQLFVDGERRLRPRLPRQGWFHVDGELPRPADANGPGYDRFIFKSGDLKAGWANLNDVEIVAVHIWSVSRLRLKAIDEASRTVMFTGTTRGTAHQAKFTKGGRYFAENVREALSEPGDWYLDRKSGVLTYLPKPGEDPAKTVVVAPKVDQFVRFKGNPEQKRWAEHIVFRGLRFAHSNWYLPPTGQAFPQAEIGISAAIQGVGARHCALERCEISSTGGYAVEWGLGSRHNRLEDCELLDLGAGGIKIGSIDTPKKADPADERVASHNTIRNCLIAHGGRMHPAAVGVLIGHSPDNVIEHNTITDLYYTGISVGWSWGYQPSLAARNTIAWNHIHRIGRGVLSDMGGIYTLGNGLGNVLHHNLIHDVNAFDYGGWGIYFDEGSTGFVAENNLIHHTKSGGFHQHYGRENIVRNNIFALAKLAEVERSSNESHLSFTFERNIVVTNGAPLLDKNWEGSGFKLDRNLYWDLSGKPPRFPKNQDFATWQKSTGQDAHSRVADPLFENPEAGDFRLRAGSPAKEIGFEAIDLSKVGRQTTGRTAVKEVSGSFPE